MKRIRYDRQERRPESQRPQPLATEGLKLPEGGSDEVEAWEAWLRHVQAGRIGPKPRA